MQVRIWRLGKESTWLRWKELELPPLDYEVLNTLRFYVSFRSEADAEGGLHRPGVLQLAAGGVPGAYRVFANLVGLRKESVLPPQR